MRRTNISNPEKCCIYTELIPYKYAKLVYREQLRRVGGVGGVL